ncbi:ABC transporter ATP-binding protein [Panacibacter ginsenosidivorans]|uniref:ABC transporter ATP-binding protein n=1 Tax=Panacibacter ginsenosidivorans TaxID=1813871 RepID=A0A5B8VC28_9BACT|nr:ABC transporter ATP-binding protein [Panacibacter ginsenosidivorans]QEC68236.1 ABC transporter ATP-binding protein [Panacibacter ginsenosidivorans]
MQEIIKVTSLTKQFRNLTAVDDLSFTVQEGDVYGFLGQNGAGKSTTIRMLLTLIAPTKGSMELFGYNLQQHRIEILRQVGAVIEKPDMYGYLSAYENLKLFAKLSGIKYSQQTLMQQLEMVGLAERAHDKVKTFSQGMKQRLGIAVALVHDPKLIILDEPTNGLDPQGIADIRNLILHLSRELKKTVLVSSHLLSEIEQVATRLLIIDKGKKLVEGTSAELFDPSQTIVELDTLNNTACLQLLQQSEWNKALQQQRNHSILLKTSRDQLPHLHKWLVQQNIDVISLQPRHTLEDFFLQVTSGKQYVEAFTD